MADIRPGDLDGLQQVLSGELPAELAAETLSGRAFTIAVLGIFQLAGCVDLPRGTFTRVVPRMFPKPVPAEDPARYTVVNESHFRLPERSLSLGLRVSVNNSGSQLRCPEEISAFGRDNPHLVEVARRMYAKATGVKLQPTIAELADMLPAVREAIANDSFLRHCGLNACDLQSLRIIYRRLGAILDGHDVPQFDDRSE